MAQADGVEENNPKLLVVGAGPTGLALAAFLRKLGWVARIIEAREQPLTDSRAVALHSRTLEMLETLGLVDNLRGVVH